MMDAQADGNAGQTHSSPRYSTGALRTARETGGLRVFRWSTAPLETHIKRTETHPVTIFYAQTGTKKTRTDTSPHPRAHSTTPQLPPKSAMCKQRGSH